MSPDERVDSLRTRHESLEAEIVQEFQRPHPDDLRVIELKREKLRIKDQIAGLEEGA